jgi:Na+-translocating ferredoxin:NAD+ oxidoreductase RnfG subunit
MQTSKGRLSVLLVVMALSAGLLLSSTAILYNSHREATAQKQSQQATSLSDVVTIQNTSMSVPAPNSVVDKQSMPNQIVVALPLRQDGKTWTGTVTFTASKPIEIEVEHKHV